MSLYAVERNPGSDTNSAVFFLKKKKVWLYQASKCINQTFDILVMGGIHCKIEKFGNGIFMVVRIKLEIYTWHA